MRKSFLVLGWAVLILAGQSLPAFSEEEGETEHEFGFNPESFEVKFYMQPRFSVFLEGSDEDKDSSFRVRRSRIYLTSTVSPNVKGRVQIEARPDKIEALDVYFDWTIPLGERKPLMFRMGQFKKPFTYEQFVLPSADLNMIDRTVIGDLLEENIIASARDLGLMARFRMSEYGVPVTLHAGTFNGNGQGNRIDDNPGKQFVGRAEWQVLSALSLGADVSLNRVGTADSSRTNEAWSADVVFEPGGLMLVSEVMSGENPLVATDIDNTPRILAWYVEGIYRFSSGWQPGARFEVLDPNDAVDEDGLLQYTGQIAYEWGNNFRFQLNAIYTDFRIDALDDDFRVVNQFTVRL